MDTAIAPKEIEVPTVVLTWILLLNFVGFRQKPWGGFRLKPPPIQPPIQPPKGVRQNSGQR